MADPVIPEKMMDATTLTCPSPPLRAPTRRLAKAKMRSVICPSFMMRAARINRGTASRTNWFSNLITI